MAELGVGKKAPDIVNIVIEIRRGEHNKYEMDKETGYVTLDRVTAAPMAYPTDYGYLPGTLCEDGDPLDALLVIAESVPQNVVVPSRAIGVLRMIDNGESDEKLICVPVSDITSDHIKEVEDLGPQFKQVIEHYYSHYKDWKNDWKGSPVSFDGWGDAAAAKTVILDSIKRHEQSR
jgi:inorganic pyrophosphatase